MRRLAKGIGILVIALGITGLLFPAAAIAVGYHFLTPVALYVIAAVRIFVGVLLIRVASGARMPKTMRAVGTIILLGGVVTPFVGIERTRAMIEWWAGGGILLLRLALCVPIALGVLILYAAKPGMMVPNE